MKEFFGLFIIITLVSCVQSFGSYFTSTPELDTSRIMQAQKNNETWFFVFYANRCDYCSRLEPQWNRLVEDAKKRVNVGKINW